jgi:hypothetical protein
VTYRWLSDLDVALDNAGVPFVEVGPSSVDPTGASSWRDRGRPGSTGNFDPAGVLCHHTASPRGTTDQSDLNVILYGNGSAPGPIAQMLIGRSATVYLVAAGRANHGGKGIRPGLDSGCADMNAALFGIEVSNDGVGEYWPDPQTTIYGRVVAALCRHYGWDVHDDVYMHATTGPPSGGCNQKIDPAGPWQRQPDLPGGSNGTWDLETWRAWCATFTGDSPAPIPPKPPSEGFMPKVIVHVDETQPAGSPGYWRYDALWTWVGAWRYHLPSELAVKQAVYEFTGDPAVFNYGLGDIRTNPDWVQPVGSLEGYGAVAGADPGDV